jgi:uncharacterized protein (DUF983 family)
MNTLTLTTIKDGALPASKAPYVNSEFKAALHCKCPKCRTGNMFANSPLNIFGQKMNENCSHCGFKFEIEPGYFYVAMFVSYAMNVAIMVTCAVGTHILTGSNNPWVYIVATLLPVVIFSPFTYRYARIILLYWLTPGVKFEPKRAAVDYLNPHA